MEVFGRFVGFAVVEVAVDADVPAAAVAEAASLCCAVAVSTLLFHGEYLDDRRGYIFRI